MIIFETIYSFWIKFVNILKLKAITDTNPYKLQYQIYCNDFRTNCEHQPADILYLMTIKTKTKKSEILFQLMMVTYYVVHNW